MPDDYLAFAKKNTRSLDIQNRVEGISNSKRAIDCQIDFLVSSLGYDYKLFNTGKGYKNTRQFINEFYEGHQNEGVTDKLKLLNILGLAPTLIISNIRKLRNLVEHEYKIISEYEVKTAVEVADLFINSSNRKLEFSHPILHIGNTKRKEHSFYSTLESPYIEFNTLAFNDEPTIKIRYVRNDDFMNLDNLILQIKPDDKFYIEILYCLITEDYTMLYKVFNLNFNIQYFHYEVL